MSFMLARVALFPILLVVTHITMLVWKGTFANYSKVMRWTTDNILVYLHPVEVGAISVIFSPLSTFVENSPPDIHSAEMFWSNIIVALYFGILWTVTGWFNRD